MQHISKGGGFLLAHFRSHISSTRHILRFHISVFSFPEISHASVDASRGSRCMQRGMTTNHSWHRTRSFTPNSLQIELPYRMNSFTPLSFPTSRLDFRQKTYDRRRTRCDDSSWRLKSIVDTTSTTLWRRNPRDTATVANAEIRLPSILNYGSRTGICFNAARPPGDGPRDTT